MEGMIWALIIVTGTASVNVSTGYPNKALCEDAISIARTGMTVMEKKSADEADRVREARLDQEFAEAHPTRPPTKDDEKKCPHYNKNGGIAIMTGSVNCYIDDDDGMIHFTRHSFFSVTSGSNYYDPAREIKYAKCVLVDPKDR